jgi:glycosyltransferase involved in cell wall biosynthesis
LGLPLDAFLVLYGGTGWDDSDRKGFRYLRESATILTDSVWKKETPLEFILLGEGEKASLLTLPFRVHTPGFVKSATTMALFYAAADVLVLPTQADNLPNVLVESVACGTPCVAFNVGGCSDVVRDGITGFLAHPMDSMSLAGCIDKVRSLNVSERAEMSRRCRQLAECEYSQHIQANRYRLLYEEVTR